MRDWDDQSLLREHVGRGSDEAFSILVQRHASLVFGAACRKLGDASGAEEVTQAVFIALARKAPFLCQHQNLSGWLHRAAMLECQQRARTEIRRRRREEYAMKMIEPNASEPNPIYAELDDALLELSEKDRQPLLLRFFEGMNFRDVAKQLGLREDAAQKRVTKSLGLLERILRKRGRNITGAALAVALAESASPAPAAVVYSATHAALGSMSAVGISGLAFGKIMAMTKLQTAGVCALLLSAPLLLQTQRLANARQERVRLEQLAIVSESRVGALTESTTRLRTALEEFRAERAVLAPIPGATNNQAPTDQNVVAGTYRWDPASAYVRLPKAILDKIELTANKRVRKQGAGDSETEDIERTNTISKQGELSDTLAEALGLNENERAAAQRALSNFAEQFEMTASQHAYFTNTMPKGVGFTPIDGKLFTLVTRAFPEEGQELRRRLVAELQNQIGVERAEILMTQGKQTFQYDFLNFGARERWVSVGRAKDGLVTIARSLYDENGVSNSASVSTTTAENIPPSLRPYLPESFFQPHE